MDFLVTSTSNLMDLINDQMAISQSFQHLSMSMVEYIGLSILAGVFVTLLVGIVCWLVNDIINALWG